MLHSVFPGCNACVGTLQLEWGRCNTMQHKHHHFRTWKCSSQISDEDSEVWVRMAALAEHAWGSVYPYSLHERCYAVYG
eukprot:174697-Pelagomonas_calceolata.AAC.2